MIRLTIPSIEKEDLETVCEVLESGYLTQGSYVHDFEDAIADYVKTKHVVAVSSCTAALHLSLLSLGLKTGDLAVVTTYSWIATANVIELCGAQPVFVDICPDTFNMDPNRLETVLKNLRKTIKRSKQLKAIIPVHAFGQAANMPEIIRISEQYGIPVVEDAACALGASIGGCQAGNWGIMGCFSFHPRKAITTGEGGAVATKEKSLADRIRTLRNHGQDATSKNVHFIIPGFNYRMTDFQAAMGIRQLHKLDRIIASRRRLAENYNSLLSQTPVTAPNISSGSEHIYQSYVILLPAQLKRRRNSMIDYMRRQGIETSIGTLHIPMTNYFQNRYGYKIGDFPVTDDVFARSISLPMYENLTEANQIQVVKTLSRFIEDS
ncbi:MAG: DegT/DnrJ/EryC1/StrS family aminotransferase [Pseudomonadota bacterium]